MLLKNVHIATKLGSADFFMVLTVFLPFLPFLPHSFFFFLLSCSVILSFFHSKARSLRILAVSLIVYYFMARGWSWSKMSSGFQYNVTLGMLPVVMTLVLIDIFAKYFKTPGTMEKAMSKAAYVHNGHAALTLVLDRLPPASHLFFYSLFFTFSASSSFVVLKADGNRALDGAFC